MAVRKGKQYYSSGEEKGKIMLDRCKVAKVTICQCNFSIGVTDGASLESINRCQWGKTFNHGLVLHCFT